MAAWLVQCSPRRVSTRDGLSPQVRGVILQRCVPVTSLAVGERLGPSGNSTSPDSVQVWGWGRVSLTRVTKSGFSVSISALT